MFGNLFSGLLAGAQIHFELQPRRFFYPLGRLVIHLESGQMKETATKINSRTAASPLSRLLCALRVFSTRGQFGSERFAVCILGMFRQRYGPLSLWLSWLSPRAAACPAPSLVFSTMYIHIYIYICIYIYISMYARPTALMRERPEEPLAPWQLVAHAPSGRWCGPRLRGAGIWLGFLVVKHNIFLV